MFLLLLLLFAYFRLLKKKKVKEVKVRNPRVHSSYVELGLNKIRGWDSLAGTRTESKGPWVAFWVLQGHRQGSSHWHMDFLLLPWGAMSFSSLWEQSPW